MVYSCDIDQGEKGWLYFFFFKFVTGKIGKSTFIGKGGSHMEGLYFGLDNPARSWFSFSLMPSFSPIADFSLCIDFTINALWGMGLVPCHSVCFLQGSPSLLKDDSQECVSTTDTQTSPVDVRPMYTTQHLFL